MKYAVRIKRGDLTVLLHIEQEDPVPGICDRVREQFHNRTVNRLAQIADMINIADFRQKREKIDAKNKVVGMLIQFLTDQTDQSVGWNAFVRHFIA